MLASLACTPKRLPHPEPSLCVPSCFSHFRPARRTWSCRGWGYSPTTGAPTAAKKKSRRQVVGGAVESTRGGVCQRRQHKRRSRVRQGRGRAAWPMKRPQRANISQGRGDLPQQPPPRRQAHGCQQWPSTTITTRTHDETGWWYTRQGSKTAGEHTRDACMCVCVCARAGVCISNSRGWHRRSTLSREKQKKLLKLTTVCSTNHSP